MAKSPVIFPVSPAALNFLTALGMVCYVYVQAERRWLIFACRERLQIGLVGKQKHWKDSLGEVDQRGTLLGFFFGVNLTSRPYPMAKRLDDIVCFRIDVCRWEG